MGENPEIRAREIDHNSSSDRQSGFSQKTCFPAASAASTCFACR